MDQTVMQETNDLIEGPQLNQIRNYASYMHRIADARLTTAIKLRDNANEALYKFEERTDFDPTDQNDVDYFNSEVNRLNNRIQQYGNAVIFWQQALHRIGRLHDVIGTEKL